MKPSILVVDDEPDLLELLEHHLRSAGHDVRTAATGEDALAEVARKRPDLVLLDVVLPDISGTEVLRRLRRDHDSISVPVIFVTARSDEIDRVIGFELGADDYVCKPFSPRELLLRIEALLRRTTSRPSPSPEHVLAGPFDIDVSRHRVRIDEEPVALTALEFRLLLDLALRRGRVQRREELLERVWQYPVGLETRTVDTHIKRLREKLGAASGWNRNDPWRRVQTPRRPVGDRKLGQDSKAHSSTGC